MGRRDRERGLWRERNGAYGGQREDGWRAGDKLSFRQRSRMCVGEKKTHLVAGGRWTSRWEKQRWRGEINGEKKKRGEKAMGGEK